MHSLTLQTNRYGYTKKETRRAIILYIISIFIGLFLLLSLGLFFDIAFEIPTMDNNVISYNGEGINSVSIEDIRKYKYIEEVNYTPNEFVNPSEIKNVGGDISDYGTYQIVLTHIKKTDYNYENKIENIKDLLGSDGLAHITLYIPPIASSSIIYLNGEVVYENGMVSHYDYSKYSLYKKYSTSHKKHSEQIYIDIPIELNKDDLTGDIIFDGAVITIHYESKIKSHFSGMYQYPIVGKSTNIKRLNNMVIYLILFSTFILLTALLIGIFTSILKKTFLYLPHLFILQGFILTFLSLIFLKVPGTDTVFLYALFYAGSAIALIGPSFHIGRIYQKTSVYVLWMSFSAVAISFMMLRPIFGPKIYNLFNLMYRIAFIHNVVIAIAMMFIGRLKNNSKRLLFVSIESMVIACVFSFLDFKSIEIFYGTFWFISIVGVTLIFKMFSEFVKAEKNNVLLTENLQAEVDKQTEELKSVMKDHENMMRFISHDMRKPFRTMKRFAQVLREREKDPEQIKTIDILVEKTEELEHQLDEINRYAKIGYVSEPSKEFDVRDVINPIIKSLKPDCDANGIVLVYQPSKAVAYAKADAISQIVTNLIVNAIEHAECRRIEIRVYSDYSDRLVRVLVLNNGKGIDPNMNIFEEGVSESNEEGHGLGLFFCRNLAESMNGTLDYHQGANRIAFVLSIPMARSFTDSKK